MLSLVAQAIDIVDEACASVRVQLDSQPEQIDILQRRKLQLEIEATALEREKDEGSKRRLTEVRQEITKIEEKLVPLKERYAREKAGVDEISNLKRKLDALRIKAEQAERMRDLASVCPLSIAFERTIYAPSFLSAHGRSPISDMVRSPTLSLGFLSC